MHFSNFRDSFVGFVSATCVGTGLACGSGAAADAALFASPGPESEPTAPTEPVNPALEKPPPQVPLVTPSETQGVPASQQPDASCAAASVEVSLPEASPVDIIVVLDNSGSMSDEARAVEDNINVNFSAILEQQNVDYRVILVSEHRERERDDTAVCVRSPLSSLSVCPSQAPGSTERFLHYATRVGSRDALEVLLESYDGRQEDDFGLAPGGWSEWLRSDSKKVFLAITDDDASDDALEFVSELTQLAPENFGPRPGATRFTWHSIVGLQEQALPSEAYQPDEPIQQERCANSVNNPGVTYQELSRLTNGLRFPICRFEGYDAVFSQIADQVVESTVDPCKFDIPAPPLGRALDLTKVAVSYQPSTGGPARLLGQAQAAASCGADAFQIADNRVSLCPEACQVVASDGGARVQVVFACETTPVR